MATKRKAGADTEKKHRKDRTKQNANLIPFVKGDARINRLGRPHNFDELRALVQEIGAEKLDNSDLTRIAAKVRQMYASRQSGDNVTLLAYGFGKPKDTIELDDTGLSDELRAARIVEILDSARARRVGSADTDKQADTADVEIRSEQ